MIGFNVDCPRSVRQSALHQRVELHLESVIYRLIETVRAKTAALLPPRLESKNTGEASVLQLFPVTVKGSKNKIVIAGCRVGNGVIGKNDKVRVLRGEDRVQVFEGEFAICTCEMVGNLMSTTYRHH